MPAQQRTMTFGIVVGNRGFFPDHLAKTGRDEILAVLEGVGAKAIVLSPEESTKFFSDEVEKWRNVIVKAGIPQIQ